MIKPCRFIAIFSISLCTAFCSHLSHSDISYTVKRWPLSQQLSQETIISIKHTDSGSLWIATLAGVDRFDGNSFTRYRPSTPDDAFIASANIFEFLETSDRQILVVTKDAGLLIYEPNADSFDSISTALDNFSKSEKISSSFIDEENNVWLGYENGKIARFSLDTGSLKTFSHPLAQSVTGITKSDSGQLLVATSRGGIFGLTDKLDFRKIFDAGNICSGFNSALDEMSAGPALSVWLGSNNDGIFFVDLAEMSCSQLKYEWKPGSNIDTSDIHHHYCPVKF